MRGALRSLGAGLLGALALAAPAGAADHLLRITEILPAGPGGAQFVELRDTAPDEAFPVVPYRLVVYSPSGAVVGRVTLTPAGLTGTDASPYLVANAAQGGGDDLLTAPLPVSSGQVCYTRGPTEIKIHCVSYGCPTVTPFTSEGGSNAAESFGAGQSLQLQASGSFGAGDPTPDATNSAAPSVRCASGAPGPGTRGPDNTRPVARLGGKKRQRLSKLAVTVTVNEAGTVAVKGSVKAGRRKLALRRVKRAVRAGSKVTIRLRLSRRATAAALAALRQGRRVTASVRVTATDAAGNASGEKRAIRVRP